MSQMAGEAAAATASAKSKSSSRSNNKEKKSFMRRLASKQTWWMWRFLNSSSTGSDAGSAGVFRRRFLSSSSSGAGVGSGGLFRRRFLRLNIKPSLYDDFIFKIVSALEAVFLVSSLCFFYCFCGCHF